LDFAVLALESFGDPERAEREAREALRLRPGYQEALIVLARTLGRQKRWAESEIAWHQVLMADPENAEARAGLAAVRRPGG
jgi:cytochrome c-type biogenesis protein CcmH/NrfG